MTHDGAQFTDTHDGDPSPSEPQPQLPPPCLRLRRREGLWEVIQLGVADEPPTLFQSRSLIGALIWLAAATL